MKGQDRQYQCWRPRSGWRGVRLAACRDSSQKRFTCSAFKRSLAISIEAQIPTDWDLRKAQLVQDSLTTGRIAVAVPNSCSLDVVIGQAGVNKGLEDHARLKSGSRSASTTSHPSLCGVSAAPAHLDSRFKSELGVVPLPARLVELGHADADDVGFARSVRHLGCSIGGKD